MQIPWEYNYKRMRDAWNGLPGTALTEPYKDYYCYCIVRDGASKVKGKMYCRKCGYPLDRPARQ